MKNVKKVLILVFIVFPFVYYFISSNIDALMAGEIKGRHGIVYSQWNFMFYFKIAFNFFCAFAFLLVPVFMFVDPLIINSVINKIREFFRRL